MSAKRCAKLSPGGWGHGRRQWDGIEGKGSSTSHSRSAVEVAPQSIHLAPQAQLLGSIIVSPFLSDTCSDNVLMPLNPTS